MKYINLTSTGVKGSELCFGCMTFGASDNTVPRPYGTTSAEIIGRALKEFTRRDGDS